MNDGAALLAAVLREPDEDTPRLVFADWLDEHDEPARAEFIRVQCEIARMGTPPKCQTPSGTIITSCDDCGDELCPAYPWHKARNELRRRERELLEANRVEWLKDAPCKMDAWSLDVPMQAYVYGMRVAYRRGFVTELITSAADWLQHADAILAAQPVREVTLTTMPDFHIEHQPDRERYEDFAQARILTVQSIVRWGDRKPMKFSHQASIADGEQQLATDIRAYARAEQRDSIARCEWMGAEYGWWPGVKFTLPQTIYGMPVVPSIPGVNVAVQS